MLNFTTLDDSTLEQLANEPIDPNMVRETARAELEKRRLQTTVPDDSQES